MSTMKYDTKNANDIIKTYKHLINLGIDYNSDDKNTIPITYMHTFLNQYIAQNYINDANGVLQTYINSSYNTSAIEVSYTRQIKNLSLNMRMFPIHERIYTSELSSSENYVMVNGKVSYYFDRIDLNIGLRFQRNMMRRTTLQGCLLIIGSLLYKDFFNKQLNVLFVYYPPIRLFARNYQTRYINTPLYTETRNTNLRIFDNLLALRLTFIVR